MTDDSKRYRYSDDERVDQAHAHGFRDASKLWEEKVAALEAEIHRLRPNSNTGDSMSVEVAMAWIAANEPIWDNDKYAMAAETVVTEVRRLQQELQMSKPLFSRRQLEAKLARVDRVKTEFAALANDDENTYGRAYDMLDAALRDE